MNDPEAIAALVERLRFGPYTCSRITGEILELLDAADMIEAQAREIAELRSWKAAEDAHHHLLRQQAKDGFAAGVEAAAKVAEEGREYWRVKCDDTKNRRESRDYETMAIACVHIEHTIRSLLQTSNADGK